MILGSFILVLYFSFHVLDRCLVTSVNSH